jgi:hypothetical protein
VKRLAILVVVVGLAACSDTDPALQDLDPDAVIQDRQERDVFINPDGYPNVVAFCDGPNRVYITTRESQNPVVVRNDVTCIESFGESYPYETSDLD